MKGNFLILFLLYSLLDKKANNFPCFQEYVKMVDCQQRQRQHIFGRYTDQFEGTQLLSIAVNLNSTYEVLWLILSTGVSFLCLVKR